MYCVFVEGRNAQGPSVGFRRIVVSRFADIAVPVSGSAMGPDTKALC
jgi:hypothetical protein